MRCVLETADTTLGGRYNKQTIDDNISNLLVHSGLSEICTYGFVSESDIKKCNISKDNIYSKQSIKIKNPLSEDYTMMKTTSVPSMMQMLENNNNYKNKNVKLFDISRIYKNVNENIEKGELPEEDTILTIGMYGDDVDFYVLKGLVENVLSIANLAKYDIVKETENEM